MKLQAYRPPVCSEPAGGFTLPELLVAVGLASVLLAVVLSVNTFGSRSFVSMGNYISLDRKSRNTLDVLSREIRNATGVVAFNTNLPARWLTLTNASQATAVTLTYDSNARTLVMTKTGQAAQTYLTECERWDFGLFSRAPLLSTNNITFYSATNTTGVMDVTLCKLISMSWKCSRTVLGSKFNTESVQTAQIVMRNKVN